MTTTPTVAEVLDLLGEASCYRCGRYRAELTRARAELNRLTRLAVRRPDTYRQQVERQRDTVDKDIRYALDHLNEPHTPKSRTPASVAAVSTEAAAATEPDDRVACPACGVAVKLKEPGRLRPHKTRSGNRCPRRMLEVNVTVPPVVVPPAPSWGESKRRVAATDPTRVVTGRCHTCDKAITPGRLYCGRCLAKRNL